MLKHSISLPWQEFRDEDLWTREVNLVFDANTDGITKIYRKYFQIKENYFSFDNAVSLMTRDTSAGLRFKEATYAYGMSKMSVKNEMEKGPS